MQADAEQILDTVLTLIARVSRGAPFESGAAEVCGKLALLGGARGLALFSTHPDEDQIELLGAYGLPRIYLQRYPVRQRRQGGHLTGDLREAVGRGEPVSVLGLTEDPRTVSLASVAQEGRFASSLALPLVFDRRVHGLVHAFFGMHLRPERQRVLIRMGPLLASVLARDALRGRLTADGDGGELYTRRQVERQVKHVHAASERYAQPYSVVVYAVDRPDVLARRYGPELVRDAVDLLVRLVVGECREADQAGLYEAASCQVVMPGTEQNGAFTQVERVLDRFGRHSFKHGKERLQLSASAGISCFPENGALTGQDSVRSARHAMTEALGSKGQRIVAIAARGAAVPLD